MKTAAPDDHVVVVVGHVAMAPGHAVVTPVRMVVARERGRRRQDEEGAEYENQLRQWSFL